MKTRRVSLVWSVLAIVTLLPLVLATCGPKPMEVPSLGQPPRKDSPFCQMGSGLAPSYITV
jgi:hypothetical protein